MTEHKPPFMLQYRHKGQYYSVLLCAPDTWADAEAHAASIALSGQITGSNVKIVRTNAVTLPFGWLYVRLVCWWRNFWRSL